MAATGRFIIVFVEISTALAALLHPNMTGRISVAK